MKTDMLAKLGQSRSGNEVILGNLSRQYTLDQVTALCNHLEERFLQEEVRQLVLFADNSPSWVVADVLSQRMNLCLVPLPIFFTPGQVGAVLGQCHASHVLTDRPEIIRALTGTSPVHTFHDSGLYLFATGEKAGSRQGYPAETGKITFTSGSTGHPRGVCLSNAQLVTEADMLKQAVHLEAPRHLCLLPLATLLENVAGVYAPLLAGGRVILPSMAELGYEGSRLASPDKMLAVISEVAPETVILIPELLKLLVSAARQGWKVPGSFRYIAVGGSRVGKSLLEEARALGLPVYEGYGLSECASVVSLNTPEENLTGSCGKPLSHLSLEVRNGELVVTGNAMLGYLNEPQSWHQESIHTGDLASMDPEGYVHLHGRKKNILISSYGRNISPEWPESELLANPALQDVVIFGDARPFCCALVSSRDPGLSSESIQQWIDKVNDKLPDYARVKAWHRLARPLASRPGMLTSNGRPKRNAIAASHAAEIAALYEGEKAGMVSPEKELVL